MHLIFFPGSRYAQFNSHNSLDLNTFLKSSEFLTVIFSDICVGNKSHNTFSNDEERKCYSATC